MEGRVLCDSSERRRLEVARSAGDGKMKSSTVYVSSLKVPNGQARFARNFVSKV